MDTGSEGTIAMAQLTVDDLSIGEELSMELSNRDWDSLAGIRLSEHVLTFTVNGCTVKCSIDALLERPKATIHVREIGPPTS